jgi:catechol 2,3-dioxygenase-like lactoylglutathione lyase family enzyme
MLKTRGLTHSSLAVRDLERTLRFYVQVFGVREYFRDATSVKGPGPHDVIAFERQPEAAGRVGGIGHFGFRLLSPADIDQAIAEVERAGGKLLRRGEFAPGFRSPASPIPTATKSKSGTSSRLRGQFAST